MSEGSAPFAQLQLRPFVMEYQRRAKECVKTHIIKLGTKWNQVGTKWPEAVKSRMVHAVCEFYETVQEAEPSLGSAEPTKK